MKSFSLNDFKEVIMAGKIQFTLNGEAQEFAGAVTGKGSLKLEMDATSLCFAMDYKSADKIILTLSDNKLKFSGSVSRDIVNRSWEGEYALKLEISKTVAARLSQEFTKLGTKTRAEITIKF
jgi:hypothetical protein